MRFLAIGCAALAICCAEERQQAEGQVVEQAPARIGGGQANVEVRGDTVTLRTRDGTHAVVSGNALELPAGFPPDVYVPADLRITLAGRSPQGFQVLGDLSGTPAQLAARITEEMRSRGFVEQPSEGQVGPTPGPGLLRSFQQGDRSVLYSLAREGTRTALQLMTTAGG
ncbi:MAG: hypothetical protein JNK02_13295 [Planctomycetes bacterium]|nr:hypothetical protein [Planctomycetota bacterium]